MRIVPVLNGILPIAIISSAVGMSAQASSGASQTVPKSSSPVSISIYERARSENWQWFAAPPQSETYSYLESLLRIGVAQSVRNVDWQLELAQPSVLAAPNDAISPISAQGQLGLGATYYAANKDNQHAAAAFLKQGYVRYHFGEDQNLRIGRFEFFDGQETKPRDPDLAWIQTNRIAQRLVGNFGFSMAQRSFDGVDGHFGNESWNLAAMAGRADQGVFNMNGNPELNVDVQYLALTRSQFHQHLLWRSFALGYHDGRTGIIKTDNRPLVVRQADRENIRIGTYGGDVIATFPAAHGKFDMLAWGVLQNGKWGTLDQASKAGTIEGGYQMSYVASRPWFRGGYFYGSGDTNGSDGKHQTFFQVLPTPWIYSHFPFYNLMNNKDGFIQVVDRPSRRLEVRGDLHWLQLASKRDLWYSGGGAYDNHVFGYTGRPSNGHNSLSTVFELTSSWQVAKSLNLNLYYGHANGKSTVASIYPTGSNAQFGYAEFIYRWGRAQYISR